MPKNLLCSFKVTGENKIAIFAKPDVDSEKVGSIDAGTSFNVVEQKTCADGRIICDSKMAKVGLMTEASMIPRRRNSRVLHDCEDRALGLVGTQSLRGEAERSCDHARRESHG